MCAEDRAAGGVISELLVGLTAVIESIRVLPGARRHLTVHIESDHIVNALSKGWPSIWSERAWTKRDGTPVKNRDLWEQLARETERNEVRWRPFTPDAGAEQARVTAIAAAQR
jgi:ribonuclease HI